MKTKMKGKSKRGKAIIGIAMAAIMLASVFATLAPMGTAQTGTSLMVTTSVIGANTVLIGQILDFDDAVGPDGILNTVDDDTPGTLNGVSAGLQFIGDPTSSNDDVNSFSDVTDVNGEYDSSLFPATGRYGIDLNGDDDFDDPGEIQLNVAEPKLELKLTESAAPFKDMTTVTEAGLIRVQLTTNLPAAAQVDIDVVRTEDGRAINFDGLGAALDNIPVTTASGFLIDTTDFRTGEYTVTVDTDKEQADGLSIVSSTLTFTVIKEEITLTPEKKECAKTEEIKFTVRGPPREPIIISTDDAEFTDMIEGVENVGAGIDFWNDANGNGVVDPGETVDLSVPPDGRDDAFVLATGLTPGFTTNQNGEFKFVVRFLDKGTFNIRVDNVAGTESDDVDMTVRKVGVIFDVPSSVEIGEEITIKGTVTAGDYLDVAIDDLIGGRTADPDFNDITVTAGEIEVDWNTNGYTAGTYTIEGFIENDVLTQASTAAQVRAVDDDGHASIRLVAPGLTAELTRNVMARGDEIRVEGTATGVDEVDIAIIGPDGCTAPAPYIIENGLEFTTGTVTEDNTFEEDVDIPGGADTGRYMMEVLIPGRDGEYAFVIVPALEAGELDGIDDPLNRFDGKNQGQVLAMIKDGTIDRAGSDDILVSFTFSVESPSVRLNPVESVAVGDPLEITGTTNREPGTTITITTLEGPTDLPAAMVEVEWPTKDEGVFNATIDTTDAVPGTYIIEADDGDGNTDTIDVEILTAVPVVEPTVTPTVTPTATPTPTPTPTVTVPTPTPTPTPTEEVPGFGAVFAIAGMLAIAYLVLRKRRE